MRIIKKIALSIDSFFEIFAITALSTLTLIVVMQIITRRIFNFVFTWSEEITLLLLIYFAFIGIAIGLREKLHISMNSFAKRLPKGVNKVLDKAISVCVLLFGIYLLYYGISFTTLMNTNTLPATGWPVSIQYVIMPITGFMICIYGVLQLIGINTARHDEVEEEVLE